MRLAILGPLKRNYEEIRLIKEGKRVFESVSYFSIPQISIEMSKEGVQLFHKNKNLLDYDVILPRIPRTYRTFGLTILSLLEESGKHLPINPMSVLLSHNKFLTLVCLRENGLPVPQTFLSLKRNIMEEVLEEMEFPVVIKLLYGSRGVGVMFADSKQSAISIIDALERFKEPIFLEEYVENPGEDIRAYVVGYEVVASMKRIAKEGERRANIGIGGVGKPYELQEKERYLAIEAAKALEMGICGVDIIQGPKGPVIIETNVSAQFQGLEKTTKINVARRIVEYLRECAE